MGCRCEKDHQQETESHRRSVNASDRLTYSRVTATTPDRGPP